MLKGLYSAATGMHASEARQAVTANNIANASTVGFRGQAPVQKGFYSYFAGKLKTPPQFNRQTAPGGGVRMDETYTNTANGPIAVTGDRLHVALMGPGYFVVDTPEGDRFMRNGKFAVNAEGELMTADGNTVQGAGGGAITVNGANVVINEDGTVIVDGIPQGRIRVVEFEDPHMLTRQGETLYAASAEALRTSAEAANTQVVHKSLEMSNVSMPKEIINMTLGLRAYEANQRVVVAVDETMRRLIEQVATPA